MLISEYAPVKQSGNGVIVAFSFSFKILAATDLSVSKIDASGNTVACVLGTDYTVAFDPIAETGTVTYTLAPVNGGYSLVQRVSDNTQQTSVPREGPMPAKTVETMIDKLTALIQELQSAFLSSGGSLGTTQIGTLAALTALAAKNPTVPFHAIVTDLRMSADYLGNTALGQSGFSFYGGF